MNDDIKIKKYLKSYLTGKKYLKSNNDKAHQYFKQCNLILSDIKLTKINEKYTNILEETETECNKLLIQSTESNVKIISEPIICKDMTNNFLFDIIDTGDILKLQQYKYGELDFKKYNENGLSSLHYAIKCGDTGFLKYAFILGGMIDTTNKNGHTLLEYACLERDPNMIGFLHNYGIDMKKHLQFRDGGSYNNRGDQIDIVLLEKIIMENNMNNTIIKYLEFVFEYINMDDNININYTNNNNINIRLFICRLDSIIDKLDSESRNTYISILKEELKYDLQFNLCCPTNKIEIVLYNLIPFINYTNLRLFWLLNLEIKFIILKNSKNKEFKNELYNSYIITQLIPLELLKIIVSLWIIKKV